MDLGAYSNIEILEEVAKKNNIHVPRLRGYRLMKDEEVVEINELYEGMDVEIVRRLVHKCPFWSYRSSCSQYDSYTDWLEEQYISKDKDGTEYIRWELIHGWKRRELKTAIHNEKNKFKKQYEVWNKYAGKDNVLYIHARIGGGNWPTYYKEVVNQPWFLEKVDDGFDSTYCDIYAKIDSE